jgi:hypothetical protein
MGRCHHQVLQPAAATEADKRQVQVDAGQPHDRIAVQGQQYVGVRVLDGGAKPLAAALQGIAARGAARRLEQLLDKS